MCDCVKSSSKDTAEEIMGLRKSTAWLTRFNMFLCAFSFHPRCSVAFAYRTGWFTPCGKAERSGQFLYPIPDRAGRPVGNRLPGSQLPLLVGHRGPGQ